MHDGYGQLHEMRYTIVVIERDIDKQLIERVLQGDKMAFDTLVTKYELRVFRLAMRLLGNPSEADDLVPETFIKAYCELP